MKRRRKNLHPTKEALVTSTGATLIIFIMMWIFFSWETATTVLGIYWLFITVILFIYYVLWNEQSCTRCWRVLPKINSDRRNKSD